MITSNSPDANTNLIIRKPKANAGVAASNKVALSLAGSFTFVAWMAVAA